MLKILVKAVRKLLRLAAAASAYADYCIQTPGGLIKMWSPFFSHVIIYKRGQVCICCLHLLCHSDVRRLVSYIYSVGLIDKHCDTRPKSLMI